MHAVVLTGAGGNFCSGGDVHEIIGPLTRMAMPELLAFTRMTGDVVKAMRACPQPIVAAVDGVCAGAGAMLALASDLRFGTPRARRSRSCSPASAWPAPTWAPAALLPRVIGQGRAAELLYTRPLDGGRRGAGVGLLQPRCARRSAARARRRRSRARSPTARPSRHAMTKTMLHQEWAMGLDEAIEAEAQAQAICMQTRDFRRAYEAFAAKRTPVFEGD